MSERKNHIRHVAFLLIFVIILAPFAIYFATLRSIENHEVEQKISEQIKSGGDKDIDSLIDQPWDELIVFAPYSNPPAIASQHRIDLPMALSRHSIINRDDVCILVFLHEKEAIAWSTIRRSVIDLSEHGNRIIIRKEAPSILFPRRSRP